ncbi:MAG: sigma 54-interacting transcriptional regulator [Pyrinomonadaceae bacterium]
MRIALFASDSVPLKDVAEFLRREGVEALPFALNAAERVRELEAGIEKGVLIAPRHGAGDATESVSRLLESKGPLLLCAPQPDNDDRRLLMELGAAEIITPRSWSAEHVAERILGQLILDGDTQPSGSGNLRGATRIMCELYKMMEVVAPLPDPALILGETGTGKELVAREIHRLSGRPDKFLAINCGELSLELAGSDLFGHRKGSFTGATEARVGLLAEAGSGTVFLDEIGELDLKAQSILLRALEEKKVRRVGANQLEEVKARFLLATNRDLEVECEAGRFRHDLFERMQGFTLELKPLRERRADIPLLVQGFVSEFNQDLKKELQVPTGACDCLFDYDWPGNIRELRAAVRSAAAFAGDSQFISAFHLREATMRRRKQGKSIPVASPDNKGYTVAFDPNTDKWKEFSKRAQSYYFRAILEATGGNKEKAIALSGLSRSQFYEKLKEISSREE